MRAYKFKKGFEATNQRLEELIKKHFGNYRREGEVYIVRFGAIEELKLWIDNKNLIAESKTNPNTSNDVVLLTIKIYNRFLEELTGYTAKERQKMLRDLS